MRHHSKIDAKGRRQTIFERCFEGLWQIELLAEVGGNLVREWRGAGLPLSAEMGSAAAFACPCGCPKIHGDRTSGAYSTQKTFTSVKISVNSGNLRPGFSTFYRVF